MTARSTRIADISSRLGTDFAGLGGDARFIRGNVNGAYYIPLERQFGNPDWGLKIGGSVLATWSLLPGGREEIIDRFFLGGDNLRGFETGGAGPHDLVYRHAAGWPLDLDAIHRAALSAAGLARSWLERASLRRCRVD